MVMGIKSRFCSRCGKETDKLLNSLCGDCYLEEHKIKAPGKCFVFYCNHCDSVLLEGVWTKCSGKAEQHLIDKLKTMIKLPEGETIQKIELVPYKKGFRSKVTTKLLGKSHIYELATFLELRKRICRVCTQQKTDFWNSKVQVRVKNKSKDFSNKLFDSLGYLKKKIVKAEEQKKGVDLFFGDKKTGKDAAGRIKTKFGLRMSQSAEQYSWNKSKNRPKYRHVMLLREK